MSQDERRLFPVRRDRGALDEQTPESSSRRVNRRAMIPREFASQCSARYSFCVDESTAAMIFREFLAKCSAR